MKIFKKILKPFYKLRATIAYENAVRNAEEQLASTGDRTYVIKSGSKLLLINRKNFRKMKKRGIIKKTATILDLQQNCYYCTSYVNGKDQMPDEVVKIKKKQCINYLVNAFMN